MWIKSSGGDTIVNSDNVSCFFVVRDNKNVVIYARMNDGYLISLRKFPLDNEDGAREEFELIRSQLERDHQRRWRY